MVDVNIVWQVATVHVPRSRAALEKFFSNEEESPSALLPFLY